MHNYMYLVHFIMNYVLLLFVLDPAFKVWCCNLSRAPSTLPLHTCPPLSNSHAKGEEVKDRQIVAKQMFPQFQEERAS